jgi:hypothetical protein
MRVATRVSTVLTSSFVRVAVQTPVDLGSICQLRSTRQLGAAKLILGRGQYAAVTKKGAKNIKDFLIYFSDDDKKKWDHEGVGCRSDDEEGLSGKWDSASNSDDVFGPGTGNHGWYTWRPKERAFSS